MAKKKAELNKGGRPLTEINWNEFDKLCGIQATQTEIADWFECSIDTIDKAVKREKGCGFTDYYKRKSVKGKVSLRRQMFFNAIEKNSCAMQIFLSKQHLGMSDKIEAIGDDKPSEIRVNITKYEPPRD